jgi:hypothetical protein
VAELLNKLLIEQTKSRPRRSNDNGLVEAKNAAPEGLPLVGAKAKIDKNQNRKGALAAGRFAPAPGSSLHENMLRLSRRL